MSSIASKLISIGNQQLSRRVIWFGFILGKRFPSKRSSKLMPRADGPFRVLQRIGENAYKIELPGDYGVSATFNVSDLSPYYEDQEDQMDLGVSLHQPGESDTGVSNKPNLVLKPNFGVSKPNK